MYITNAAHAFDPLFLGLDGKTIGRISTLVHVVGTSVQDDFHRLHRFVTLTADVMFVNGVSFYGAQILRE